MILEKNNLQTAQEWTKSYIELIASYVHLKIGNHVRSYLTAIMAFDHRILIRPGKKITPNFLRSTSLLCKILPKNLGTCKPTFYTIYTSHLRWNWVLWGTVFIIQTSDRKQYFTILQYKLHSFNIQDDGSTRGLLAKPLKNFQNHLYGHPVLTSVVRAVASVCMKLTELRSNIARHFEYSCERCSLNDWKQTAQRLKLQERLPTINKRNIIRRNIYRDNNFHSGRQVLKCP